MNNDAVLEREFTVIAVTPDVIELSEVSTVVFPAVLVVPKTNGHAGKGLLTHQFAFAALERRTGLIPKLNRHTEGSALDLACVDRSRRAPTDKAGNDVGTTCNRCE